MVWRSAWASAKLKSAKVTYSHVYIWRSRTKLPNLNQPIMFAMAIWDSTPKFNSLQYFRLYSICTCRWLCSGLTFHLIILCIFLLLCPPALLWLVLVLLLQVSWNCFKIVLVYCRIWLISACVYNSKRKGKYMIFTYVHNHTYNIWVCLRAITIALKLHGCC